MKREFDTYRKKAVPHPWMTDNQIKAVPMQHDKLEDWRHNFTGITTLHKATNLHIFGAIDDLWVDSEGGAIVVDYKATAKDKEVDIDSPWQISYKRQIEIYQWLLRQNNIKVNDTGYFVYTNGRLDKNGFFDKVEFRTKIIPYQGNTDWIDPVILKIKDCMDGDMPPVGVAAMGGPCDFCEYARKRTELTINHLQNKKK